MSRVIYFSIMILITFLSSIYLLKRVIESAKRKEKESLGKSLLYYVISLMPAIIVFILSFSKIKAISYAYILMPIYTFCLVGIHLLKEKKVKCLLITIFLYFILGVFAVNFFVIDKSASRITSTPENLHDIDCILVLGAKADESGPSPILEDRLNEGVILYKSGIASKIIMSGDHGRKGYDEVNAMKAFAIEKGIPSEDIFMDHAGFSTYDSIYRTKAIFNAKKIVIVSQKYHLYRALYIAESLGLEAYGVASDLRYHSGATGREIREILARDKDVVKSFFKLKPKYLGETIPVSGNGDITNDKE